MGKSDQKKDIEGEASAQPVEEAQPQPASADKAAEYRDQMLRMRADFDNTKKRLERDKADAIRFANEKLLGEILHIVDNFDRAMTSLSEGHDPAKVKQGLEIAQNELHKILERHGVQTVKTVAGAAFDPQLHEAVGIVETDDKEEGAIVDELQRGYLLNGRLLRPSKVRIAQKKH